jgi:hypothetical protein
MKKIMSWKIFESYYMNESNVPKWTDSYKMHINHSIPLTPTITKLIFEGKRSVAFHISDIDHNKDVMSLEGTKKPISCFTYYKDMETTKITPHTKGGVVYLLEGDLFFSLNKDSMSIPDESGRRWISSSNFPSKFQNELFEWRGKNSMPTDYYSKKEYYIYLKKYIPFIEGLVKKYVEEIRRFCNLYWSDSEGEKEDDYNEIVLSNIKVKEVLLNKDVIIGYDSDMPALYDDNSNFEDTQLNQIIDEWEKKSIKVVIAENKDEVLKWFHKNGGITDRYEFIKGKEAYGVKFW